MECESTVGGEEGKKNGEKAQIVEDNTTHNPPLPAERETCLVVLCDVSEVAGGSQGQETVSGAGRVRIQARGLDGVRTELTPRPCEIHKWTEASDGTGPESETCSRLTRAGVNFQRARL